MSDTHDQEEREAAWEIARERYKREPHSRPWRVLEGWEREREARAVLDDLPADPEAQQ